MKLVLSTYHFNCSQLILVNVLCWQQAMLIHPWIWLAARYLGPVPDWADQTPSLLLNSLFCTSPYPTTTSLYACLSSQAYLHRHLKFGSQRLGSHCDGQEAKLAVACRLAPGKQEADAGGPAPEHAAKSALPLHCAAPLCCICCCNPCPAKGSLGMPQATLLYMKTFLRLQWAGRSTPIPVAVHELRQLQIAGWSEGTHCSASGFIRTPSWAWAVPARPQGQEHCQHNPGAF